MGKIKTNKIDYYELSEEMKRALYAYASSLLGNQPELSPVDFAAGWNAAKASMVKEDGGIRCAKCPLCGKVFEWDGESCVLCINCYYGGEFECGICEHSHMVGGELKCDLNIIQDNKINKIANREFKHREEDDGK